MPFFFFFLECRSDEKSACVAICDRMGLKGYQVDPELTLFYKIYQHPYYEFPEETSIMLFTLLLYTSLLQIGKTKVFLRAGQMAELDARRTEVLAYAARRIQRQIRTYLTRKEFITLRRSTINMQKIWRGKILFHQENTLNHFSGYLNYIPHKTEASTLYLNGQY